MNSESNKRVDEILNSLNGVKRASVPDFFYTRLRVRMEKQLLPGNERGWALRPVYALIALFIVLLINAAVVFRSSDNTETNLASNDAESVQSLAAEYRVTDAGNVYDLNQDK
jgi:hypothetical protein